MMLPRRFALAILVAVAAACGDPAGSERGTYVLRTVGDSTVPFVSYDGGTYRYFEVADTIALDGRGGAREVSVTRTEYTGQSPLTSTYATPRRYSMRGDTVDFVFTCPPDAACVLQLAGYELVTGGMATYALDPTRPITTSFFERVR